MVKELIRFIYVIAGNLHRAWMIPLMGYYSRHPEKYSERFRYEYNKHAIRLMNHTGRIYTQAYGAENLPKDGGYVMFANHQGKYDALGIMLTHEEPCSVVMDEARSKMPLVKQFIDMVGGKRLCLHDLRQAARVIRDQDLASRNLYPASRKRGAKAEKSGSGQPKSLPCQPEKSHQDREIKR